MLDRFPRRALLALVSFASIAFGVVGKAAPTEAADLAALLEGIPVDAPLYAAIRREPVPALVTVFAIKGSMISPGDNAQPHAFFDTTTACSKCHDSGAPGTTNKLCTSADCHAADIGRNQTNKSGLHGSQIVLSRNCGECHTDHQGTGFDMINGKNPKAKVNGQTQPATPWGTAMQSAGGSQKNWDHDLTGYRLLGGHKIDCDKCHKPAETRPKSSTRTFLGTDQDCLACHANYHEFPAGDDNRDCLKCHTFDSWTKKFSKGFDHDKTSFPLKGAHAQELCTACHPKGKPFKPVAHETCETCHTEDGQKAHNKTFASKNCEYCHSEVKWSRVKVETVNHSKFAKYDANGAHAKLACAVCHKGLKSTPAKGADGDCLGCHNNIHDDRWMQGKTCLKCHSEERWRPTTVDNAEHKTWTNFDLTGRHLQLDCIRCHRDLKEIPGSMECNGCHVDPHKGTRGKNCAQCHSTKGWEESGTDFDHAKTKFPLTGRHKNVACEQCHKEPGVFKHDTKCVSCHGAPHLGKLTDTCDKCHDTSGWENEIFDHQKQSKFKLTGRHLQVDCYKCHLDMGFKGTPMTCRECHSDYHKGAWGATDCEQCHNERRWEVDRNTLIFQSLHNYGEVVLSGAHERLQCETCHAPQPRWLMTGFGGECNTCHPDVHLGGRGQECHTCHNQQAWLPATNFNHMTTGFPLYGSHRLVECLECHKGNVYAGLPDDCGFCHAEDAFKSHGYTRGPDCSRCHVPTRWSQFEIQ